jgi:hypothetical protein
MAGVFKKDRQKRGDYRETKDLTPEEETAWYEKKWRCARDLGRGAKEEFITPSSSKDRRNAVMESAEGNLDKFLDRFSRKSIGCF